MVYYTLSGIPYIPRVDPMRGIVLCKASRRKSTLNTGDTKTVNGVTYTFNENRRWTRADKKSRPRKSSPGANKRVPNVAIPILEDPPKVKGKPRRMTPAATPKANTEATAKQARRTAPRAMTTEGLPQLTPKGKPAQVKPKGKAKGKKPASGVADMRQSKDTGSRSNEKPAMQTKVTPKAKTAAIMDAAKATKTGRLGDSKVFISHVWETVQKEDPGLFKNRDEFNQHLLEANRKRDLDLSRADMAYALDQDDVKGSELIDQNSSYHFIRIDGPKVTSKATPKAKAEASGFEQIKTAKRFEEVLLQNIDKLRQDYNLVGPVPIGRLRKEMGDIPKSQFDKWLMEMQSNDLVQLTGGEDDPKSPEDAVDLGGGIFRTDVKLNSSGHSADRGKPQQRPKNVSGANAITSSDTFKGELNKIYDKLNDGSGLVPIYQIRRELGDRVSRSEFNNWLMEMQSNDLVQLMGEQVPSVTRDQLQDSVTIPGGGYRFYVKRL